MKGIYPDSNHVYHLGIDLAPDEEMREYAAREGFVIVTKDSDFSELCILGQDEAIGILTLF